MGAVCWIGIDADCNHFQRAVIETEKGWCV